MKIIKSIPAIMLAMFIGFAISAFAQDPQQDLPQNVSTVKGVPQTLCPVMGTPIDKDYYVDYEGKRIYLCCGSCEAAVKADPEKYIRKLEKQGVILEKVGTDSQRAKNSKE